MYVDGADRVTEISSAPPLSPGAPMPVVLADEVLVQLGYVVHDDWTDWRGLGRADVDAEAPGELYAIITFDAATAHTLGPPNDEAFSGHPLYARGLRPYTISEVLQSSWVRSLERMNSVHPQHSPELFSRYRHFVFAFHDSTFECIAEGFTVAFFKGSVQGLVSHMATKLAGGEIHRVG